MHHHESWGLRDVPAALPNYAPSKDRPDIVPVGFVRNEGPGRINFPITDLQGYTQQPDYVQVVMTYDPFVLAIIRGNPYLYGQALHIKPCTVEAQRRAMTPPTSSCSKPTTPTARQQMSWYVVLRTSRPSQRSIGGEG